MPACSTGRSEFYLGRRRRPLPENQTSGAVWPRRECPRSGSIGVKDPQSMASPRSQLVTWSYTHLSFNGRRFWRPHPDLDRAATPALPPGGGRPLCGGRLPLLAAFQAASPRPRKPLARGRRPGAPRSPSVRKCAGWMLWDASGRPLLRFHRFGFTGSSGCRSCLWLTNGSYVMPDPLLAEPLGRSLAYGTETLRLLRLLVLLGRF